ncbi:MAG: GxxExxY protein [Planctomycetaceae bacterium]|nr:GxxExxY protein [Planctomycetaceae bacterium]
MYGEDLTKEIIAAAIEVNKTLGPGLLESVYEECFCHELGQRRIEYQRQLAIPVKYKACELECGFRIDVLVANAVVVELKSIEKLLPIHEAQLMTYLRLSQKKIGLLMNFNVMVLKDGILRRVC